MNVNESDVKVCVITVTYGNRWHLLEEVIEALKKQSTPVSRIVVVDNGSTNSTIFDNYNNIDMVRLDKNYGSAAGYKAGLERAYQTDCDLIWFLDDDNKPHPDALERLLAARKCLGNNEKDCFASIRLDREKYVNVAFKNKLLRIASNSFMGFTITSSLAKIVNKLIEVRSDAPNNELINPVKKIGYAIFGGLLFNKAWIDKIGYPDESYFTYMDDVDYTTRMIKAGGNIYLVATSVIEDIDRSWSVSGNKYIAPWIDAATENRKICYTLRNRVYLENKYFVKNRYIYLANIITFLFIQFCLGVFKNRSIALTIERMRIVAAAIKNGFNRNMGRMENEKN